MKVILYFFMIGLTCLVETQVFSRPRSCPICPAEKSGDIVHRGSQILNYFPGHAGIYIQGQYFHVNPGFDKDEAAIRKTNFADFLDGNKFWGAKRHKRTPHGLSGSQLEMLEKRLAIIEEFGSVYDSNHLDQKGTFRSTDYTQGKVIKRSGYYEFDCVGFTEHLYEAIGLNLTPDHEETPFLTPKKQSDSVNNVHTPTRL